MAELEEAASEQRVSANLGRDEVSLVRGGPFYRAQEALMHAASDIFPGWFCSADGHDYYVRQFRDMKVSAEVETFQPGTLVGYATIWGWALARAHAKAGDAAMIAGYLGSSERYDDVLVEYARAYADQAERDFATFQVGDSFQAPVYGTSKRCRSGVPAIAGCLAARGPDRTAGIRVVKTTTR